MVFVDDSSGKVIFHIQKLNSSIINCYKIPSWTSSYNREMSVSVSKPVPGHGVVFHPPPKIDFNHLKVFYMKK